MEMIWNKWMPWAWVAMLFGYRFPKEGDYPEVPEGFYRLSVAPRAGHAAKDVLKQFGKVFSDKMGDGDTQLNREDLSLRVSDYFDFINDGDLWGARTFAAQYFTFELDLDEREKALKQLKGCNALKVVRDEVKAIQEDAAAQARWRSRNQYYDEVAEALSFEDMEAENA